MVTQKDIAAACGVSTATVSKALNDLPDISDEMKRFICETAARMGYRKALRPVIKPRSHMIGLLVTEDAETFFHQNLILEIRQTLIDEGYDLVMLSPACRENDGTDRGIVSGLSPARLDREEGGSRAGGAESGRFIEGEHVQPARRPGLLSRARLMGLDGIILISAAGESSLYQMTCNTQGGTEAGDLQQYRGLRDLITSEVPVVSVDCSYGLCGSVLPAYEEGIRTLLSTACRMGHSRIALVYGSGNAGTIMKNEFRRMCADLHLNVPVNYLIRAREESMQDAYEAVASTLQGARWIHPTCYLFGDDFLLEGGCAALRSRGCRIPEDVSVASVSCENLSNSMEGMVHALTSWRIRPGQIAEEAVGMLLTEIRSPGKTSRQTRKVPGHMQLGETIGSIWIPGGMYRAPGEPV